MWKAVAALMLIGVAAGRVSRPYDEARMREAIEKQCKMYGAEDHVDEAMRGMLTFVDCISGLVDRDEVARLTRTQGPQFSEELLTFVKQTCKNQKEINQCFYNMYEAIAPCIDSKSKVDAETATKDLAELTDLFCKDESKNFSEFINDGALTCMETKFRDLVMCMNKIQTLQTYKTVGVAEACGKVEEVKTCIVETLNQCPKPSTANFVSDVIKAIMRHSQCESLEAEKNVAINAI